MVQNSEIIEIISDIEDRMKYINIARFIVDGPYKDQVRDMGIGKDEFINIVVMVLDFIKGRTLGSEQRCNLEDIEDFLDDLRRVIHPDKEYDSKALARIIIVDVLQKGGILTSYKVYSSSKERFESMPIRLLEEEAGTYHLSDDAFDFLFRTKEIDSELDYSVTRFRMAEYMKRDNYIEALDQSRELVAKVRSMKLSMDDFIRKCRENISKITVDQYENVVKRSRLLLESEYEELQLIQASAKNRAEALTTAYQTGVDRDQIIKHRKALKEIIENISITIEEQKTLINKEYSISNVYQEILSDSYSIRSYDRLDFEKDILMPLRTSISGEILESAAPFLLLPLITPTFERRFTIESLYAPQVKIQENDEEESLDLGEDVVTEDLSEKRNNRNLKIIKLFFEYMKGRKSFKVSEFICSLADDDLFELLEEKALPQVIMALFAMGTIPVKEIIESEDMIVEPNGEFSLDWCLDKLGEERTGIETVTITMLEREFNFSVRSNGVSHAVNMTDFIVEVV